MADRSCRLQEFSRPSLPPWPYWDSLSLMGIEPACFDSTKVIYAIFRFCKNTITGLKGIDPSLQEAGIAFGMTQGWERLKKFEIPLLPCLSLCLGFDGSRSDYRYTATLAASDWCRNGPFILWELHCNNTSLILIGALSLAVLAIAFNFLNTKSDGKSKIVTIFLSGLLQTILLGSASYSPAL